jgi:hypothetical protein
MTMLADTLKKALSVEDQYETAKALAANCGYKLVPEDDERSLQIKDCIIRVKRDAAINVADKELLVMGLEALLK